MHMEKQERRLNEFSAVVEKIYAAAHSPRLWEEALEAIAHYGNIVQIVLAQMYIRDRIRSGIVYRNYDLLDKQTVLEMEERDLKGLNGRDTVGEKVITFPEGTLSPTHHPEWPDLDSDGYYQAIKPIAPFIAGINLLVDDERINGMGLLRTPEQGEFTEKDLEKLRPLIPHLQQAVRINETLYHVQAQEEAMGLGLDLLTVGVVLFDRMGNIIWSNPMARQLFRTHPAIRLQNKQVFAHDPDQSLELRRLIGRVIISETTVDDPLPAMGLTHPDVPYPLAAFVRRLDDQELILGDEEDETETPLLGTFAALYLSDPGWEQPMDGKVIAKVFGLSKAESTITVLLTNGLTVPEIAKTQHLSEHTVRTHMKNIYPKIGVNRQTDLVRVVLNGVGALRG